jgi:hypothetical protein
MDSSKKMANELVAWRRAAKKEGLPRFYKKVDAEQ